MTPPDSRATYAAKKKRVADALRSRAGRVALSKHSISNLFRYAPRRPDARRLSLGDFDRSIHFDAARQTLDVEGLATFERIADITLPHGLMPPVTPELKHITIGGALCGIGIESTGFRHGFVHDSAIDADVLLGNGRIVSCSDVQEPDLFHALPNSYGTLGYVLRTKIRLEPVGPYVHLSSTDYRDPATYLDAMRLATEGPGVMFVEGLIDARDRLYLLTGRAVDRVPYIDDIVRRNVFHRIARERRDVYLTIKDYLFRYDPDWFWNVPDGLPYRLFRALAPRAFRNSAFYTRYVQRKRALLRWLPWRAADDTEPLIQDWEVPWTRGRELLELALAEVDLEGRPWAVVPIRTPRSPTLYPVRANELYLNLGCYCFVRRHPGAKRYHFTKILDRKCFELGGLKMLYSSSFVSEEEFDRIYAGDAYRAVKRKYDPDGVFPTLYEKCGRAPEAAALL